MPLAPISQNFTVTSTAVLTDGFVTCTTVLGADTTKFGGDGLLLYTQLELLVDFTLGSLTDGDIKVLVSNTSSDPWGSPTEFHAVASESTDGTTGIGTVFAHIYRFTATAHVSIPVPIGYRWIAILIGKNGTVTNSSMTITASVVRNVATNI